MSRLQFLWRSRRHVFQNAVNIHLSGIKKIHVNFELRRINSIDGESNAHNCNSSDKLILLKECGDIAVGYYHTRHIFN